MKLFKYILLFALSFSLSANAQTLTGPNSRNTSEYIAAVTIAKTLTRNRVTDNYTLVLTDNFKLLEMNAATAKTITVPPNSSVAFTADQTQITIARYGAGALSIVAGSGVTINSADGALDLRAQFSMATLIKIGTNEWYLIGDIE
jgi:hypothetical protein